jgi:hypothetical protein
MITKFKSIIFGFLFLPVLLSSQVDSVLQATKGKRGSREMGINVYSSRLQDPIYHYHVQNVFWAQDFIHGLFFRYKYGQNVCRFSFNYFQRTPESQSSEYELYSSFRAPDLNYAFGIYKAGEVKAGYQYLFSKKRITPFVFTDLCFRYSQEWGAHNGYFYPATQYIDYFSTEYLKERFTYQLSTGMGLRLQLGKNVVVNIETQFSNYFYKEKDLKSQYNFNYYNSGLEIQPLHVFMGLVF